MLVIVTAYGNKSSYFVKILLFGRLNKFLLVINWTVNFFFFGVGGGGFTPCKAEEPLQSMELQEKETQKDSGIQEICLERTYSYKISHKILDLKSLRS